MPYTVQQIQKILQARWLQKAAPEARVEQLLLDSRAITAPRTALFFALAGQRHDGHRFLDNCYRAGVRHFVLSRAPDPGAYPEANILMVDDTLAALQQLAAYHRAQFDLPVLGITGSNGKTVVKEWLAQLLPAEFRLVRSPKSYNSQVGVPLSVWGIRPEHRLGIFEAGISRPGEMERLARIIRPTIGLITNLGPAHREGFASEAEKLTEKMRLFDSARLLVYCADQPEVAAAAEAWQRAKKGRQLYSWSSRGRVANLQIQPAALRLPWTDAASIENACHCLAVVQALGVPLTRIRQRLRRLAPVEMRLELKAGINGCTVINDAYSNDLASLKIALQFARQQSRHRGLTLVLSDFLQTGATKSRFYGQVAALLAEFPLRQLIAIGPEIIALRGQLAPEVAAHFYPDTAAFLQNISQHDFNHELILVKGARPFAFERIARRLEKKAHKTTLEINLSALVHNLNVYNRLLQPGVRTMAMVKAAGYGSGAAEVAKLLEFHQVDYLGVAYADEGIELRQAGVQLPILVLNPEPASFDALARYRLEPEVYSLALLDELLAFLRKNRILPIHLKLDTGMHRLGFEAADLPALCERLRNAGQLQVRSVFSHLSASDNPAHDAFTHQQAATFLAMYTDIQAALGYAPLRHICNSAAIARFPEYHFDMVRLGIGLYGIDSGALQDQLQVVNSLKATISQIKEIPAGDTVGYNRNGPIDRPSRIATVSIGYADGLLRLAGNGRYAMLIHGQPAPTVGNVCMDMTMVDVSRIPQASEGDEVLVFGEEAPVQALAACLQTIPYEVFTNISERVKRVYWQE